MTIQGDVLRASLLLSSFALTACPPSTQSCRSDTECAATERCTDNVCVRGARSRDAGPADASDPRVDAFVTDAPRPDAGPPRGAGCSSDLRDVLDDSGAVMMTCPEDQGCSEGMCIPACDAADASHGTVGCTFHTSTPPSYAQALPPCFASFVVNTWSTPAHLTVERAGVTLDVTRFGRIVDNAMPVARWAAVPATGLPPDSVAVLFLSSDPASIQPSIGTPLRCPITPAVNASTVAPHGSWDSQSASYGDSFTITSDVPVRAYDMLPFGGAPSHFPSAQLLLPTGVWGREYLVTNAPVGTHDQPGPMWIHILAGPGGANVTLQPTVPFVGGGGLPPAPAGAPTMIHIEEGRYAQYEMTGDPSGSLIVSDADVLVAAGNRFLRLQPMPGPGGESTHQQLVPVDALSFEYVAAPYATRRADLMPELIPYRVVGAFNGTTLTYDPPIAGAPVRLARGQVVDFTTREAFVVRSQDAMHPFALEQMMTSAQGMTRTGAVAPEYGLFLGDEEAVVLPPPAQFLNDYTFFSDPSYPTTTLTLVRTRSAMASTTVDCLGEVTGWQRVGMSDYEWVSVDLIRGNRPVGTCRNGTQQAHGNGLFGVMVWGLDSFSSYAYPAGGNAAQLAVLDPIL